MIFDDVDFFGVPLDRFKASLCEFVRKTSGFECMC